MNQSVRQQEILRQLSIRRNCSVTELSSMFDVSEETIRRDIRQLEELGEAVKVHGGVRLPDNVYETPFLTRMKEREEQKRLIATTAAALIPDGSSIFIDAGSTSAWTAKALSSTRNLTILTNSIEVARDAAGQNNSRTYFAGGEISADYAAAFGATANDYVRRFSTDIAILSIGSIQADQGFMDFHMGEAEIKRIALERAHHVLIVADGAKFNRRGLIAMADFDDVDMLVSDVAPPPDLRDALQDVEVIVAQSETAPN